MIDNFLEEQQSTSVPITMKVKTTSPSFRQQYVLRSGELVVAKKKSLAKSNSYGRPKLVDATIQNQTPENGQERVRSLRIPSSLRNVW